MDAAVKVLDLLTARLRIDRGDRRPIEALGCLVGPERVVTVGHLFDPAEGTGRPVPVSADVVVRRQGEDGAPYDAERRAALAFVDHERDVAMLPLLPAEPLVGEMPPVLAERDPVRGDTCTVRVLRPAPTGSLTPRPGPTPMEPLDITAHVVGPAEVDGRKLRLRAEGPGAQQRDSGSPVFMNDRLVGLLAALGDGGQDLYVVPASTIREALEAFDAFVRRPDPVESEVAQQEFVPRATEAARSKRAEPPARQAPRRARAAVTPDLSQGDDLLGVQREVEGLAAVVAARDTAPPLSIGLFGNWGTGKSFFMTRMEREVNDLRDVARKRGSSAYCPNIVQLRFNAWHYMDTDLWASLAAEIFEGLATALKEDEALLRGAENPAQARARLLATTSHLRDVRAQAEQRKVEAAAALRESEQQLASLAAEEREIEARLTPGQIAKAASRFVASQPRAAASLERAARRMGIPQAKAIAVDTRATMLELKGIWGGLKATWLALRNRSGRLWLLTSLTLLLLIVAASALVAFRLELKGILTTLLSLLAAGLAGVKPVVRTVKESLRIAGEAREANETLIADTRTRREKELRDAHDAVQQRVAAEEKAVLRASDELASLERELDALRADREMERFIASKHGSTDYTSHFGVIAKARHDFERLTELLKRVAEEQASENPVPRIDRIVLYIDDLDRCPEEKVVDVLQAVHLLLAFPLFIVVVGVDSRWLLHSLRRHASAFQRAEDDDTVDDDDEVLWQSTPFNYLEKIFQIPFNLRGMDEPGYSQLIGVLTAPRAPAAHDAGSSNVGPSPATAGSVAANVSLANVAPANVAPVGAANAVANVVTGANAVASPPVAPPAAQGAAPRADAPAATGGDEGGGRTSGTIGVPARRRAPNVAREDVDPNPPFLELSEDERAFMRRMHALIPTPRAAKRYVNVYRLMRALVSDAQRARLDADGGGQCRHVLLLLAILTGFPQEGTVILRELLRRDPATDWWDFVDDLAEENTRVLAEPLAPAPDSANGRDGLAADDARQRQARARASEARQRALRWEDLHARLQAVRARIAREQSEEQAAVPAPTCGEFREWARHVARYSFEAGRVVGA